LPHCGKALIIDKVYALPAEHFGVGCLDNNREHVFDGHFSGNAIFPGHWLIEFASLTCAAMFTVSSGISITGTTGVRIVGLDGCRFYSEVRPWNKLLCRVELIRHLQDVAIFSAEITREENVKLPEVVCRIKKLIGVVVKEKSPSDK
jgi:3-hydroxymyristoyl/3-hydroxydecanoyl-(acyl carrier protein) dehydratase